MYRKIGYLLAALPLLAACEINTEPYEQTLWHGELLPNAEYPDVDGSIAAVSDRHGTEIGIGVIGFGLDIVYQWSIRGGDCKAAGPILGSEDEYPKFIVLSDATTTSVTTFVSSQLVKSESYHVSIQLDADDSVTLACGALVQKGTDPLGR